MNRDPLKLIIALGFAGVLALMGLISFISLSQMNAITKQMSVLLEETNAKNSAANSMRDNIRLRGDALYKMYLTDDYIERDRYRLQLAEHGLNYKNARDTLSSFHMSAREAKLLDQIIKQSRLAKQSNDTAAEHLLSDIAVSEIQNDLKLANMARQEMLVSLDELVALQEEITRSAIHDTENYQETISNIILFLSLAAFFIAVFIAQLVIRETSKKNYEIRFQATHDELTRLANRKEFNHRLKEAFKTAVANGENHALCFLDLDNFKMVNDSCGHKAGDELLVQLTQKIKNHIRGHDTFARLGGDEFGLLLEGCSLNKAVEIAEGIVNLVKSYGFVWRDKEYHVGVSIGLVIINHETQSIEKALTQADIACYAAKDMGRGQVQIHGSKNEHTKKIHNELSWIANINDSDSSHRFSLYLQKIESLQTDQSPPMYEVLLRINNADGDLVSPGTYIPAAERFNLMKDVDCWVIEQAFKHLSDLYRMIPHCQLRLFINISANALVNIEFTDFVIQQHERYNIAHDAICLEIAESDAVNNINQVSEIISALHKYNIRFALDNFGTGASAFTCLKKLPVDYLKIDGDIIKNIAHNTTDKAIVAAVSQIGKVMNIGIIAKHVENVFTLNQLREIGIDFAQGFYLDEPKQISEQVASIQKIRQQKSTLH
jgi:diguanylate cyclase (GGDEF)-like protein